MKKMLSTFCYVLLLISQANAEQAVYTYDNLHRLVRTDYSNGITVQYTYDEVGNRLTKETTQFPDTDGDGYYDNRDNCPTIPNPGQEDLDADGIGDVCDECPDQYIPNPLEEDTNCDCTLDSLEQPRNLLANAGFESGLDSWTTDHGTMRHGDPPPYCGNNFLMGATDGSSASYTYQMIDLISEGFSAEEIDSGNYTVAFGGWQSGWHTQRDSGMIEAILFDESLTELDSTDLGWFYSNNTWTLKEGTIPLSPRTRFIRYGFHSQRYESYNNDGYLDAPFLRLIPAESDCTDGLDNDGDALVDCDDPDCLNDHACACPGDLDCDCTFTGTDVLIQASMVVDLIDWTDLPPECIASYEEMMATCDWDCSGSIDGTDVLIGASIIVDIITEADTPLGQGCP